MKNTGNSDRHPISWYLERIAWLAEFMTPDRERVLREVIDHRTRYMTVCTENTYHPHNASALLRHCDAFGVQDIHIVEEVCRFMPSTDVVRGTDQWLTFHRHASAGTAVAALKDAGYRIIATTPHMGDVRPEDFDVEAGRFALVFGTERDGISPDIIGAADGFIRIPMCGFVESLNVSAAAAIIIYILSEKMRTSGVEWRMTEEEKARELFEWMMCSVRESKKILGRYRPENEIIGGHP